MSSGILNRPIGETSVKGTKTLTSANKIFHIVKKMIKINITKNGSPISQKTMIKCGGLLVYNNKSKNEE